MRFEQLRPRPSHRLLPLLILVSLVGGMLPAPMMTQAEEPPGWSAVIHGAVRDAVTQAGVEGARIEIRDVVLTTGADGAIPETPIPLRDPVEEVDVTVTADGYGLWRYRGVELKASHRVELRIELRDQPTIIEPQDVSAAAAPYDGPPDYIRVGRTFSTGCEPTATNVVRVDRMPFIDYVKNVLPNEWVASWHQESLKAGAAAITQYAWSTAFVDRKWSRRGFPFDVLDSTCDQVYKDRDPAKNYSRTDAAVTQMWGTALLRPSDLTRPFIVTYYRDTDQTCAQRVGLDCMGQRESNTLATSGYDALSILGYYYGRKAPIYHTNTAPESRALALYRSPDVTIAPGERAALSVCLLNAGKAAWDSGTTGLAVLNPDDSADTQYRSPLADESWPSPQLVARLDSGAHLGEKATLRFMIAAPDDLAPGTYPLLVQPAQSGTAIPTDRPLLWNVRVVAPVEMASVTGLNQRVWLPMIQASSEQMPPGCQ